MKKLLTLALTIALLLGTVTLAFAAEPPAESSLGFAVASDLHYKSPRPELEINIAYEPVLWYANRRCAMEDESGYIIDEFLRQCAENPDCEFVLISGDLADSGRTRPEDHLVVAQKLRDFELHSGKQVFVINGNHDASIDSNTDYELFKEIYAEFGYNEALEIRSEDCSYTADLSEKYRLIALDSNHPRKSTEDGITSDKLSWVRQQAKRCRDEGKYPILMMHHNLLEHLPMQRIISRNFIIKNHLVTAERFANWGIKMVLTGHEHCNDATVFTSAQGNKLYDFATTSLTMFPLQYRFFSLSDAEIKYENKTVESFDFAALTENTAGYTSEMLDLMRADLYAYSKAFLKAGVRYRLSRDLNVEKMGVNEGDPHYEIVATAVNNLTKLLEMPFYGEDSVSALAASFGISLPETEYQNGWELIGELMAWHYAGEEPFDMNETPQVTLLLRTAACIVKKELADVSDVSVFKAANSLLEKREGEGLGNQLAQLCAKSFGAYTPFEYLVAAIAAPIAYSFTYDSDSVPDNFGAIEGYGAETDRLANLSEGLRAFFERLELYLRLIMQYLLGVITQQFS